MPATKPGARRPRLAGLPALALVTSFALACAEPPAVPEGDLYNMVGDRLHRISLPDRVDSVVYRAEGSGQGFLSPFSGGRFLVDEPGRVDTITAVDPDGWTRVVLGQGSAPAYVPAHDRILFYDRADGDTSPRLYDAPASNLEDRHPVAEAASSRGRFLRWPPVAISADEVAYVGADGRIWVYDMTTMESAATPAGDCSPLSWRPVSEELVCERMDRTGFDLVSLETGLARPLVGLPPGSERIIYDPGADRVFVSVTRDEFLSLGRTQDLYVMDLPDGSPVRAVKDVFLQSGFWVAGGPEGLP